MDDIQELYERFNEAVGTIIENDNFIDLNSLRQSYYDIDIAAERFKNILKDRIEARLRENFQRNMMGTPRHSPPVQPAPRSPGRIDGLPFVTPNIFNPTYRGPSPPHRVTHSPQRWKTPSPRAIHTTADTTTIVPTPAAVQPGRVVFPTIPRLNSPTRMGIVVDPVQPLVRQPTVPQPLSPTVTNIIGETVKVVKAASPPRVKIPTVPQPTRVIVPTIQVPRVPIPQIPTARVPQTPRF